MSIAAVNPAINPALQSTTTTPPRQTLTQTPSTSTPSNNPSTYLFLLLLLAAILLLTTFYILSRRAKARAHASRQSGVRALALDVEALAARQHPRTLSPSTPLPPRGWRFARLLRLPTRRRVVDEDADWELDVDDLGRAPPPYGGVEGKEAGLPAYEEVCGGGGGGEVAVGVGVVGERVDEVAARRSGGEGLRVPERVVRRGSEGDWRGSRSRDRDGREEGRRVSS